MKKCGCSSGAACSDECSSSPGVRFDLSLGVAYALLVPTYLYLTRVPTLNNMICASSSSSSSSSTSRNAALACSTGGGVGRGAFQARVRPLGQNRGASSASSMAVRTNGNVRRVPHAGALDAKPPALIRADTERSQALVSRVKKRKFGGAGACALQFALSAAQQSAASAGFLAAAAASVSEQQLLQ